MFRSKFCTVNYSFVMTFIMICHLFMFPTVAQAMLPQCESSSSDSNNDGYGWENNSSCVVPGTSAEVETNRPQHPTCSSPAVDPDGDGWGWENDVSCVVSSIQQPDVEEPDVQRPDDEEPDVQRPDVDEPDDQQPDVEEPDVQRPDDEEPDVQRPDDEEPDVQRPDDEEPDVQRPDAEEPDVEQPDPSDVPTDDIVTADTGTSLHCPEYEESSVYRRRPAGQLILNPRMHDWEEQIEFAESGTEVLLQDGVYKLDKPQFAGGNVVFMPNPDITVRSQSGNADKVIIQGSGYPVEHQDIGFMVAADGITIADLTIVDMQNHAISIHPELAADGVLEETYIYNLNIEDIGTQHIKGNRGGITRAAVIACSSIGYTPGGAVGDYNGGIDIHASADVVVRDNYIYNITGDGSGCNVAAPGECPYISAPAIYMNGSSNSIIERNTVVDSWRGISLGLVDGHTGGIVRNNFVYRSRPGNMGISIERTTNAVVEHNTVLVEGSRGPIEVRGGSGHTFRNNLSNAPLWLRDDPADIFTEGNMDRATEAQLIDPDNGPHLKAESTARGAGVKPTVVTDDFDGDVRSGSWDVGADQY